MMAFFLSGLGLKILAGIAIVAVATGFVLRHDHRIRAAEEAKWKPRLTECTTANTSLQGEYSAFVAKHNQFIADMAARSKASAEAKNKALAALQKSAADEDQKIAAARAAVQPTTGDACVKASDRLRALATDLLRDAAQK